MKQPFFALGRSFGRRVVFLSLLLIMLVSESDRVHAMTAEQRGHASNGRIAFETNSNGHALVFDTGDVLASNGIYALHVNFEGANQVEPFSDNTKGGEFERVSYRNLWDRIDLVYEAAEDGIFASTYTIEAYGDPSAIRLRYNVPININSDGSLDLEFPSGRLSESAPIAWQEVSGTRQPVPAAFHQIEENVMGFRLGAYDPGRTLYVDPTLSWSTFLGSSALDWGTAISVNADSSVYVTGYSSATWSAGECTGCPIRPFAGGSTDVFVSKIAPNGKLVWNTFIGGTGDEWGYGIASDPNGSVFVVGYGNATWGTPIRGFSGTNSTYDAFVARLDANGNLVWHTFLGSTDFDFANGIAVDVSSNSLISGYSYAAWGAGECDSCPIRAKSTAEDAFVAKLDANGSMTWNTFVGGPDSDAGNKLALDPSGNAYLTGFSLGTWGTPRRPHTSGYDAFVSKIDPGGHVTWNTFLGGTGYDVGYGIALDTSGSIIIAGVSSDTWASPVRSYSSDYDAFAAKLNPDGVMLWNTFLGGSDNDSGFDVATDRRRNIYITGISFGTWGNPLEPHSANADGFMAKVLKSGALSWNLFFGGDENEIGRAIAVDASATLYVGGESYDAWGNPVRSYKGDIDAYVVKFVNPLRSKQVTEFQTTVQAELNLLNWRTTTESEIAGFYIWRQVGNGKLKKLNKALIPAKRSGKPKGKSYSFEDESVSSGTAYKYQIEVIYLDNHSEWTKTITLAR